MGHQYRRAGVSGRKELMAATTGSDELQQASFAGSGEISVWRFETWGRLMIVGTGGCRRRLSDRRANYPRLRRAA